MGKHDISTPINETLEQHYQSEIKRLNTKVNAGQEAINELMAEIERLNASTKHNLKVAIMGAALLLVVAAVCILVKILF